MDRYLTQHIYKCLITPIRFKMVFGHVKLIKFGQMKLFWFSFIDVGFLAREFTKFEKKKNLTDVTCVLVP